MVQMEALISGTPVVATDLPGVRQPVLSTGMGEIVSPRDSKALAESIVRVLESGMKVTPETVASLTDQYAPSSIAAEYESLYGKFMSNNGQQTTG